MCLHHHHRRLYKRMAITTTSATAAVTLASASRVAAVQRSNTAKKGKEPIHLKEDVAAASASTEPIQVSHISVHKHP